MTTETETKQILRSILQTKFGDECMIHCELGQAEILIQRVRVELSRIRSKVIARGGKPIPFKLLTKINRNPKIGDEIVFIRVNKGQRLSIELTELDKLLLEDDLPEDESTVDGGSNVTHNSPVLVSSEGSGSPLEKVQVNPTEGPAPSRTIFIKHKRA